MIYRLFDQPRFHDEAFYRDREVADHLHELGQRQRLLRSLSDLSFVLAIDPACETLVDLGCGNGGFLYEVKRQHPQLKAWGYDLSPKAVEFGRMSYGVDIEPLDFTDSDRVKLGQIVLLTETLEHLVDPERLLTHLRGKCRWLLASVPAFETDERHYEFHLWAWTDHSFPQMFANLGYAVLTHYLIPVLGTQFVIAHGTP